MQERRKQMFKMFHYMKERWHYMVMIIVLLFIQAFCDLSLPDYTSKIINVGIQQKGVEDGVPETIRAEAMDKLLLFLEQKEAKRVLDAYENKDGIYELQDVTEEEREKLNQILGIPELIVTGLSDGKSEDVYKRQDLSTAISSIGLIAGQIMAGKALFEALGLPGNVGAIAIAVVVLLYSQLSGLWGAFATSVVQTGVILVGLVATTIVLFARGRCV